MGIFDSELDLPGVSIEVEADHSYGYDSSLFGSTDSVVVIGTAFDGPVGRPEAVVSPEYAQYLFGDPYDSKKRQEVSLVAGIQDAWDRGCRTIYGVRVGGKEIHKDFAFKIDTPYKLRVSSMFPSNTAKECYIMYDGTRGKERISFYKPVSRATIIEKKRGLATDATSVLKTTIKLNEDRGLTSNDRLVDLINEFNGNTFNNVLKLAIVDKDGNDVTDTPEVFGLSIGALYSGVYFIGRDHTNPDVNIVTETQFVLTTADIKPYTSYEGKFYRDLIRNTDVTLPYPIYAKNYAQLRADIKEAGISTVSTWDFLEVQGITDRAFVPDEVDYEETNLSKFEIYKRLGSGFAVTAHAVKRKANAVPRIKESEPDDPNHITPIMDGIYSTLQDKAYRYRVLVCANAEDSINGKLPRAKDFKVAAAKDANILGGDIKVTAKVEKEDLKAAHKFSIEFKNLDENGVAGIEDMSAIDTSKIYKIITKSEAASSLKADDFENGTIITDGEKLYRVGVSDVVEFVPQSKEYYIADGETYAFVPGSGEAAGTLKKEELPAEGKYILGETLDRVFVFRTVATGTASSMGETVVTSSALENIGDLSTLLDTEENRLIVSAENFGAGHVNKIVVASTEFDNMTVDELVEELNNNAIFGALFKAELTEDGAIEKDMYVTEADKAKAAFEKNAAPVVMEDRDITYDYDLYIPYRTTDNFARQLAQHATYTELKTAPTHGIIGVKTLTNTGVKAVAEKVAELKDFDFDLYAKNNYGREFYDNDSMPYQIGKNISLVFTQYPISVGKSNYSFQSNGAAGYAGMVSTLPLDQSSTGQPIALGKLSYYLTNSQLSTMTKIGIVTIKESATKGLVVTDGTTMDLPESIYHRLNVSRIVGAVEELIRAASEPFIGKENTQQNRDALNTAIKGNLDKIKGKLINQYEFTMSDDANLAKLAQIKIYYQIIPIYEIREIRNSIKMVDTITSTTTA